MLRSLCVLLAFTIGCGDTEPAEFETYEEACAATPGCGESPYFDLSGPKEPIWRVTVFRETDGIFTLGDVDSVDVLSEVGIPPGPATGEVLLVARDSAGVEVDGQLLHFADTRSMHYDDSGLPYHEESLIEGVVSAVGYLRGNLDATEIALVDDTGTTLVTMATPAAIVAPRTEALSRSNAACAHVQIMDETDGDRLRGVLHDGDVLVTASPALRTAVEAGLNRMPRLLCHSVSRIAFMERASGVAGFVSQSEGDIVVLNARVMLPGLSGQLGTQQTLLHEATHAATFLLGVEGRHPGDFGGMWAESWRSTARTTIRHVRLQRGLVQEWERLHEEFVELGWAAPHPSRWDRLATRLAGSEEEALTAGTDQAVALGGAMSRYGATRLTDDIAEMVAWGIMGPVYADERVTGKDIGCQVMRAHMDTMGVPSRFAALYTKLHFARDLGLISTEDVAECVGDVNLEGTAVGFTFRRDGSADSPYVSDVRAYLGTGPGAKVFVMNASGTSGFGDASYPAVLTLQIAVAAMDTPIEEVSWPRGVYPLGPGANLFVEIDGAPNFLLNQGFVLAAESSNTRIAGSLFVTGGVRDVAGGVPEVFDPPYVINFAIENPSPTE